MPEGAQRADARSANSASVYHNLPSHGQVAQQAWPFSPQDRLCAIPGPIWDCTEIALSYCDSMFTVNQIPIIDTFAEAFPMTVARVIVTALDLSWA